LIVVGHTAVCFPFSCVVCRKIFLKENGIKLQILDILCE
jgi:hypothetical protein